MIKTILSKEGVKRILAKHDTEEMLNVYIINIMPHLELPDRYYFQSSLLLNCQLDFIEKSFERDDVMFIRIDSSDEKIPTTLEDDNEL